MKFKFCVFIFMFLSVSIRAQTADEDKKGTIRVRKIGGEKVKIVSKVKKIKPRIYSSKFRRKGTEYRIVFPKNYSADLFPLVFNNNTGLVITDGSKNITDNIPLLFNYDRFVQNIFMDGAKDRYCAFFGEFLDRMGSAGSYAWISHLSFKDKNGVIHKDEIPEFKVERLN
jgi:hypothetical protein